MTGRRAKRAKIWAFCGLVDTYYHIYFDRLRHWFHRGGATVANTEIDCNSETAARRAKRTKIWALWGLVDAYYHIYFDRLKHRFHRGGATAAAAANTEIACKSKTAARRAKWTKSWSLWGVVHICQHMYFDRLKHRHHRGGATAACVAQLKLIVTRKRLNVVRNGRKCGPSRE